MHETGQASEIAEELGPAHTISVDGFQVTYHRHLHGMRAGSIHTIIGDFGSIEELVRYVRARNDTE